MPNTDTFDLTLEQLAIGKGAEVAGILARLSTLLTSVVQLSLEYGLDEWRESGEANTDRGETQRWIWQLPVSTPSADWQIGFCLVLDDEYIGAPKITYRDNSDSWCELDPADPNSVRRWLLCTTPPDLTVCAFTDTLANTAAQLLHSADKVERLADYVANRLSKVRHG